MHFRVVVSEMDLTPDHTTGDVVLHLFTVAPSTHGDKAFVALDFSTGEFFYSKQSRTASWQNTNVGDVR